MRTRFLETSRGRRTRRVTTPRCFLKLAATPGESLVLLQSSELSESRLCSSANVSTRTVVIDEAARIAHHDMSPPASFLPRLQAATPNHITFLPSTATES